MYHFLLIYRLELNTSINYLNLNIIIVEVKEVKAESHNKNSNNSSRNAIYSSSTNESSSCRNYLYSLLVTRFSYNNIFNLLNKNYLQENRIPLISFKEYRIRENKTYCP